MRRAAFSLVVVAIALALAPPARSAPITFDLTGVVGAWSRSTDGNASNPALNGGPCTPGMNDPPAPWGAGNDCFRYPYSAGSSITIDITGNAVTMLGGSLIVDSVTPLVFDTIVLTQHYQTTIASGATGTIDGNYILWSTPSNVSTVGTIVCNGGNCGLLSMPEGQVFPLEPIFTTITNTLAAPRLHFGEWVLDGAHTTILASSIAISRWSGYEELLNRFSSTFTFGPTGLGVPYCESDASRCEAWYDPPPWDTPEPALSALVILSATLLVSARRRRTR
jgi:hypothetical protein